MSKKILFNVLILSFLALGFAKAQNIQFEDAKFKAMLLSAPYFSTMPGTDGGKYIVAKDVNGNAVAIDTNGDGEISQAEALNIYELNITEENRGYLQSYFALQLDPIKSLKGIEYFTNLTQLTCGNNYFLKSLDLSALTKLKEFYCSNEAWDTAPAWQGTNVLWTVNLRGISSLILPKTQSLEVLDISGIPISSQDFLSGVTNLKKLVLNNLPIEENVNITGSQFPHLEELSVTLASPNENNITISDLPELTKLTCNQCHFTLDGGTNCTDELHCELWGQRYYLGANPNITLSNLPKVDTLRIKGKNITINNLPNLASLDCSGTSWRWETGGVVDSFGNVESLVLNGVPLLEELHIGLCNLKSLDLSNAPNLIILDDKVYSRNGGTYMYMDGSGYLENLDVSKNTKLQSLVLSKITGLKTVDLSKNIDLQTLDLNYSTEIEALDLPKNTNNLQWANLSGTRIEILDISKNINLQYLDLSHNSSLQTLDISKNINLQYLDLSHNSSLQTLDVSKNINLQTLDLSYNSNLQTLDLPKDTNNLQTLDLSSSAIEALDVSKNINLQTLYLGYTGIETLDLSKNVNLRGLDLSSTGIKTLDLSKNVNLYYLDLHNNTGIETLDVTHNISLDFLFLDNTKLTTLYMKNGVKKAYSYNGYSYYSFSGTDNLNYICCDEDEVADVESYMKYIRGYNTYNPVDLPTITSDCGNEDLEVSDVTENSATLSWSAVAGATSYTIEYRKTAVAAAGQGNTTFADDWATVRGITATTYTLTGLADGSVYEWRLTAVGSGNETPVSGPFFTTEIKSLGTEDLSPQTKVALYPNPVKDVLYFSTSGKVAKAEVYDLNGRIIKTAVVSNNSVNVSSLSKGVYFIILHTDKGVVKEKFIKN